MEINKDILKQLKEECRKLNCDTIDYFHHLYEKPVYIIRRSDIPDGARVSVVLFSYDENGNVFRLNDEQEHEVIVLRNSLYK